jgi:hypothetical protein
MGSRQPDDLPGGVLILDVAAGYAFVFGLAR